MSASPDAILQQFVGFYFPAFSSNRASVGILYRPVSVLKWEGKSCQGPEAIVQHLTGLPFQSVEHRIVSQDHIEIEGGLFITVTGQLIIDRETPLSFTQSFILRSDANGFYIHNEIFRLVYG
ncbi:hypothetical protein B0O80DRAFT_449512 [Mortierella sp. GBAus27b]|nr:Nuclear transport factor 2 [Mortierella sp. GBA43]KAI8354713.1 hypothetical protein B0O80DRAFT_449512 [Mortierella sp. GBAus27b]